MSRHCMARLVVICLLLAFPVGAQENDNNAAYDAMYSFLESWLVEENESRAMSFFDRRARATAEDAGYSLDWELLNRLWAPPGSNSSLRNTLSPIDPDLKQALDEELEVDVEHTDPFTVFVADSDLVVNSFDAGYGDTAEVLKPSENRVLAMIVDFADRSREEYPGPFIAFWSKSQENGEWKIQVLGAAPEGLIWLDGK